MAVADSFIEPEKATAFPYASSISPIFLWYIPMPFFSFGIGNSYVKNALGNKASKKIKVLHRVIVQSLRKQFCQNTLRIMALPIRYFSLVTAFSGVTFDRPNFNRMIAEIEAGNVATVIVKDMSRLGRDYLKVGYLLYRNLFR